MAGDDDIARVIAALQAIEPGDPAGDHFTTVV